MCVFNTCVTLIGSTLQKYCEEIFIAVCQYAMARELTSYNGDPYSDCHFKNGNFLKNFCHDDDLYFGIG